MTKLQEILKLGMKEVILAKKKYKKFTIYILMQVNNAGVPGGKLIDGDALLRKVFLGENYVI